MSSQQAKSEYQEWSLPLSPLVITHMHLSQQPGFLVESIHFSCSSPLVVQMSIPHLNYCTTFATGFLKVMQSVPQSRARMVLSKHKVTHITPPPPRLPNLLRTTPKSLKSLTSYKLHEWFSPLLRLIAPFNLLISFLPSSSFYKLLLSLPQA